MGHIESGRGDPSEQHLGLHLQRLIQFAAKSALEPLTNAAVVDKFRRLTSGVLDHRRQQTIERLVLSLDELDGLADLVELLARPVASPFES